MCPPGAPQPYAPTGPPQPYAPTGPPGAPQPYAPTGPPVSQPYAPPVYAPPSSVPPPQQMYPTSPASPMSVSSNDPAPGVPLCVGTTPVLVSPRSMLSQPLLGRHIDSALSRQYSSFITSCNRKASTAERKPCSS